MGKGSIRFSWQIVPENLGVIMFKGSRDENQRTTEALLKMKKIDIAILENAYFEK
jgi:predicted 3-demethylubiquinone-9 3-methyltransferase (glyoxalase superfamily)